MKSIQKGESCGWKIGLFGRIFETDYADVAVRLAAGYLRLWPGLLMQRLWLRCDLVGFVYRLRLLDHHRDELVPVWFLVLGCDGYFSDLFGALRSAV